MRNPRYDPHSRAMHCIRVIGLRQHHDNDSDLLANTVYDPDTVEVITRLIISVGLDPNTCTADDLDDLNARFYCQECPKGDHYARTWRNCAEHVHYDHPPASFHGWIRLSPTDTKAVIALENADKVNVRSRIMCAHCTCKYSTLTQCLSHCEEKHGTDNLTEDNWSVDRLAPTRPISLLGETEPFSYKVAMPRRGSCFIYYKNGRRIA